MTIEDAINRAKLLTQARLKRERGDDAVQSPSLEARSLVDTSRAPARPRPAPAIPVAPLRTVEISAAACERHRVLVSESQLREFSAADAAYRLLRSRLLNRFKRNDWFSLAVAGPSKDDGKTITTLNLAICIARERQKAVYLLDLDMRNPSVCKFLGIRDLRPLPDFFLGQAKPEDVLAQTTFPNLIVAGALGPTDNASEMLAGPKLNDLLAHIRLRSPDACVLIDLPPVIITDEALLVAPRMDAILIVVSEGKTERQNLAQTLRTLSEFTIAGVVINRSSESYTIGYEHYTA